MFKRPMLAASLLPPKVEHTNENILAAMKKLKYPVLVTVKKDGIRALRLNKTLLSRTLKQIPNRSICERAAHLPGGFDMELWNPCLTYDEVESIVMSREHSESDKIQFHVLDWFGEYKYADRINQAHSHMKALVEQHDDVIVHLPEICYDAEGLLDTFIRYEVQGHEGVCFRTPDSPYKQGRSTLREQYLVKLCRYIREEVTVIALDEQMENGNRAKRNGVGMMDRSSCQDNLYGKDTLGAFKVLDKKGRTYSVGTGVGLTDILRKRIWQQPEAYIGKQITIKFKPHGEKDNPRSPIFVGFREKGY